MDGRLPPPPPATQQKDLDTVLDIVGEEYRLTMSGYLFVKRKDMFRDAMFKCKGYAEPDVSEEEVMTSGQCGCLDLDLTEVSSAASFVWIRVVSFRVLSCVKKTNQS